MTGTLDGTLPSGGELLECLTACYAGFREQLVTARELWSCQCDACVRVATLDLKFVLHAGSYVIHSVGGSRELAGSDVVIAHRLLKNRAAEVLGIHAYALVTDAAMSRLGVPADGSTMLTEHLEGDRPIETRVFPLA
jgi:hypothetical protein